MNLYEKLAGVKTRWSSFENPTAERGKGGTENSGAKGHAFDTVMAGETKTLLDFDGSGTICRIWLTVSDRSPEALQSLRIEMTWDNAELPAVSCPLGDFFCTPHGIRTPFENALFSDPEGRSFNCAIPMPFRTHARITLTNDSDRDLTHLFFDVNFLTDIQHSPETLYFHSIWRRESPNALGEEFKILPHVSGKGRFLGCNVGVIANPLYEGVWWGEGEVKVRFGSDTFPTLCGTGAEDYIGTAWGQGVYAHRSQGCLLADSPSGIFSFYRLHLDDPVYFDDGIQVSIQTIGGCDKSQVLFFLKRGIPLIPVTLDAGTSTPFVKLLELDSLSDLRDESLPDGWCNFWRKDDWRATAYFYLDSPCGVSTPLDLTPKT